MLPGLTLFNHRNFDIVIIFMMVIQRLDFRKEFFATIMTLQQRAQLPNRGATQFIESGFLSALSDANRSIKCTNCGKLTKECGRGSWVRSYLLP